MKSYFLGLLILGLAPLISYGIEEDQNTNNVNSEIGIHVGIKTKIILSGLDDVIFSSVNIGEKPPPSKMYFCVGTNTKNKKYSIRIFSTNSLNDRFYMRNENQLSENDDTNRIEYDVMLIDLDNSNVFLQPNKLNTNIGKGFSTNQGLECLSEDQVLEFSIISTEGKNKGSYSDTINVIVNPL